MQNHYAMLLECTNDAVVVIFETCKKQISTPGNKHKTNKTKLNDKQNKTKIKQTNKITTLTTTKHVFLSSSVDLRCWQSSSSSPLAQSFTPLHTTLCEMHTRRPQWNWFASPQQIREDSSLLSSQSSKLSHVQKSGIHLELSWHWNWPLTHGSENV